MNEPAYNEAILQLAKGFHKWIKAHPTANYRVEFNYPQTMQVIFPWTEAVKAGFLVLNEEGWEMLKAVCHHGGALEETPTMIRVALQVVENPRKN